MNNWKEIHKNKNTGNYLLVVGDAIMYHYEKIFFSRLTARLFSILHRVKMYNF